MGTVTLPGYVFLAHTARMWRVTEEDDDGERSGWGFDISTWAPVVQPPEDVSVLFDRGVGIEAFDAEPIPLPEWDDLTGLDFRLDPPIDEETGECYFSLRAGEWHDASRVRMRFLERVAERYRIEFTAEVHLVFVVGVPTEIRYDGWIDVVGEAS